MPITIRATGPIFSNPSAVVDREIRAELGDLGQLGVRILLPLTPNGVSSGGGGLRGSTFTEHRGMPGHRSQVISQSAFYAEIVERGRRPGKQPPASALLRYVQLKVGARGRDAARVAFLVARKIGQRGFKRGGAFMFARTWTQLEPIARQRLSVDLPARIARALGGS